VPQARQVNNSDALNYWSVLPLALCMVSWLFTPAHARGLENCRRAAARIRDYSPNCKLHRHRERSQAGKKSAPVKHGRVRCCERISNSLKKRFVLRRGRNRNRPQSAN